MSGAHNAFAGLFALAVAEAEGLGRGASIEALARTGDVDGRGRHHAVRLGDGRSFTVIDDSYNASPASVEAAIRDLGGNPRGGRRVAVLADMLELGDDSEELHKALAQPLSDHPPAVLILYGRGMEALAGALGDPPAGGIDIRLVGDASEASEAAFASILDGDLVLVKGSKSMRASAVARDMIAGFPDHPASNGASHVA